MLDSRTPYMQMQNNFGFTIHMRHKRGKNELWPGKRLCKKIENKSFASIGTCSNDNVISAWNVRNVAGVDAHISSICYFITFHWHFDIQHSAVASTSSSKRRGRGWRECFAMKRDFSIHPPSSSPSPFTIRSHMTKFIYYLSTYVVWHEYQLYLCVSVSPPSIYEYMVLSPKVNGSRNQNKKVAVVCCAIVVVRFHCFHEN